MSESRAVCLNCIDGRVQLPVIHWIKQEFKVDYVDMVTEPGVDGLLADKEYSVEETNRKIKISIEKNRAKIIVVVGHHDCKGNPVSDTDHKEQIQQAVERLRETFQEIPIVGLWVNSEFKGEKVEGNS